MSANKTDPRKECEACGIDMPAGNDLCARCTELLNHLTRNQMRAPAQKGLRQRSNPPYPGVFIRPPTPEDFEDVLPDLRYSPISEYPPWSGPELGHSSGPAYPPPVTGYPESSPPNQVSGYPESSLSDPGSVYPEPGSSYSNRPQTQTPAHGPALGHPPVCGAPPTLGTELASLLPRVVELAGREGLCVALTRAPSYVPTVGYNPASWIDPKPGEGD